MSDDLISRKALRDELCKYRKQFLIGSCENIIVSAAIGFVNSAPTAFDKEKVIDQLKEEGCIIDNDAGNRAIEIIEKGGIE